ncbi:MAG: hypothetical protein WBG05_18620, partial [Thermoanaerobaculia bacterium]
RYSRFFGGWGTSFSPFFQIHPFLSERLMQKPKNNSIFDHPPLAGRLAHGLLTISARGELP